jgi:transposase
VIGSTRNVRVFAATQPTSMRLGFESLELRARADLGRDPMSGDLFLFVSKDRRRAKVLYFDGTGMCLFYKWLAKGRFAELWRNDGERRMEMTVTELTLFIEGSQLVGRFPVSPSVIGEKELEITIAK